jgi:ribosomal protein L12E/L44/L45/RPP1/RPP2
LASLQGRQQIGALLLIQTKENSMSKTIKMLTDETGADGESLNAGEQYTLNDASADRWLRRRKAELVATPKAADAKPPAAKRSRAEMEQAATARKVKFDAKTSDADLEAALTNADAKAAGK